jgi:hypothetical protein
LIGLRTLTTLDGVSSRSTLQKGSYLLIALTIRTARPLKPVRNLLGVVGQRLNRSLQSLGKVGRSTGHTAVSEAR